MLQSYSANARTLRKSKARLISTSTRDPPYHVSGHCEELQPRSLEHTMRSAVTFRNARQDKRCCRQIRLCLLMFPAVVRRFRQAIYEFHTSSGQQTVFVNSATNKSRWLASPGVWTEAWRVSCPRISSDDSKKGAFVVGLTARTLRRIYKRICRGSRMISNRIFLFPLEDTRRQLSDFVLENKRLRLFATRRVRWRQTRQLLCTVRLSWQA